MSPKATLLVVGDEPEVREVLQEYLARHDYTVLGAESAAAALAIVGERPVDLALVDIRMPGEEDLSLARFLRERHAGYVFVPDGA
ncbi:MAG: response regulator [Burkholderiaceae bacterium]